MRDETAKWLEPMIGAADQLGPDVIRELMSQASMPAAESDTPFGDWLSKQDLPAGSTRSIDWVRFGQLLRDRLGWDHYPETPQES